MAGGVGGFNGADRLGQGLSGDPQRLSASRVGPGGQDKPTLFYITWETKSPERSFLGSLLPHSQGGGHRGLPGLREIREGGIGTPDGDCPTPTSFQALPPHQGVHRHFAQGDRLGHLSPWMQQLVQEEPVTPEPVRGHCQADRDALSFLGSEP